MKTISAAALVLAVALAGPAFAQETEGGKQPAKEGVQAGQQPSETKDTTKPGAASGQGTGTPQATEGGKQPAKEGVQAGQQPSETKDTTK